MADRRSRRFRLGGSSLVAALMAALLASTAAAQQSAQQAPSPEGATPSLEQIIITAPRSQTTARAEEFLAPNIVSVQSAEQIARFPDFDAAEAVGRLPGVALSSDTGEGRFVNIRGIDANLNGTTFGGVVLLNTNPGGTRFGSGRAVELDTIPVGSVDRIVVTKTGLPDHEAEGLGGSIDLIPRSAAGITAPLFAEFTLGGGYEALRPNWSPFRAEAVIGGRFGIPGMTGGFLTNPRPFSFVFSASENNDRRAVDDLEETYATDNGFSAPGLKQFGKVLDEVQFRRYNYHRQRSGVGGDLEFQPNDDTRLYLRANVAGYTEPQVLQLFHYTNMEFDANGNFLTPTALVDPAKPNGFLAPNAVAELTQRNQTDTARNTVAAFGGSNNFHVFSLDYQLAYSRATLAHAVENPTFTGPSVSLAYNNVTDPRFPRFSVLNGANPLDPTLYNLSGLDLGSEKAVDHEWSGRIDVTVPVRMFSEDGHFKFGGKVRLRTKVVNDSEDKLDVPGVPLTQFLGEGPFSNFYGGRYNIGFNIDPTKFGNFVKANMGLFVPQTTDNQVNSLLASFAAKEDIYAGYAQYDTQFGPLGILGGVRAEATRATYSGTNVTFDANGNPTFSPTAQNHDYMNLFPTLQLRYQFDPATALRATYSTGIGRPGFIQIAPTTQVTLGISPVAVSTGNPKLNPITSNNFDLSLTRELPNAGAVEFGIFDKEIKNYVVTRTVFGTFQGTLAQISTFENAPASHVRGLEALYSQRFAFLPAPFDGLGMEANMTLVDSRVELRPGDYRLLPGTSKITANASLSYIRNGVEVQLSAQEVGKSLFTVGRDGTTDVIQDDRLTLDLTSSFAVRPNIRIYFNAKNLLNTPLTYYEGTPDRLIQREFYDVTLELGLKANF